MCTGPAAGAGVGAGAGAAGRSSFAMYLKYIYGAFTEILIAFTGCQNYWWVRIFGGSKYLG